MDAKVAARFYRVSSKPADTADFPDLLLEMMKEAQVGARERNLEGSCTLRLENCEADGEFVSGEFCRKQTVNIPPAAGPEGLKPIELDDGTGMGHVAAFRFHRATRVLLFQHNLVCASANRVGEYLSAINPAAVFTFVPILREDAWERFTNKDVRALRVSFASPANLEALDEAGVAAAKGARLIAEAYNGVSVEIVVSVGKRRKKFLNFAAVRDTLSKVVGSNADVNKANVRNKATEEDDSGAINFLREHLRVKEDLTLPENDHASNYQVRKAFLAKGFNDKMSYLLKHFGPQKDDVFN